MEALGIDGKFLLAQIINFAIFFYVYKRYIAKPFHSFLSKQRKQEEEQAVLMEKLRKGEEQRKVQETKMKAEYKKISAAETKKARQEAAALSAEIIASAKQEARTIVEKGREQIVAERTQMETDMKKRTAELSMLLITKGLDQYLSPDMKRELTKHVLSNLQVQKRIS